MPTIIRLQWVKNRAGATQSLKPLPVAAKDLAGGH